MRALTPSLALAVFGCAELADFKPPSDANPPVPTNCVLREDCGSSHACVGQRCVIVPCQSDLVCTSFGMTCDADRGQCACADGALCEADPYATPSCDGHCTNGVTDCGETGPDCGGACAACAGACDNHCQNFTQDCGETGVDCGGSECGACDPCFNHCGNGVTDCGETGVDCGGPECNACFDVCSGHCANGVTDCGEDDTDCGGECTSCPMSNLYSEADCIKTIRNGSEICDDAAWRVPSPGTGLVLVCLDDRGGKGYISSNTGPQMQDGIRRCQGWETNGMNPWDHLNYLYEVVCDADQKLLNVDLSSRVGNTIYVGVHDYPNTGNGHFTTACLAWRK